MKEIKTDIKKEKHEGRENERKREGKNGQRETGREKEV